MSMWTYVTGCILIDTMEEKEDIKAYIKKMLKDAPKITGSEQDVDIFINPLSGCNVSTMKVKGDAVECKDYQTCAAITLVGSLRDREIKDTQKELEDFIEFVDGTFCINNMGLNLSNGYKNINIFFDNDTDSIKFGEK